MPFIRQFLLFKPLSYCFEETIGFDEKASFPSRPVSRQFRFYNKPGTARLHETRSELKPV